MLETPAGDRILPAQPSATHAPVDTVIDTNFPLGNDVFARMRRHREALRLIVRMRIEESGHMYANAIIRRQAPAAASRQKNGCLTLRWPILDLSRLIATGTLLTLVSRQLKGSTSHPRAKANRNFVRTGAMVLLRID